MCAVDIVIVPPEEIQDVAIGISKKLNGSSFVLGKEDYVPHVSLLMGYTGDVGKVTEQVEESIKGEPRLSLSTEKVQIGTGSVMLIAKNRSLTALHFRLLNGVNLVNHITCPEGYVGMRAGEESLLYIKQFTKQYSRQKYVPHITLGDGNLPKGELGINFPIDFEARTVALFHLGDHNTCRELLASWELGQRELLH